MSAESGPAVDWHVALAYALTGERLDLPPVPVADPDRLLADLAARGWDAARLAAAGRTPHQVPVAWVRELGPAQFAAALAELRRRLGGPAVRPVSARALDADEQRLSADRPPHWG